MSSLLDSYQRIVQGLESSSKFESGLAVILGLLKGLELETKFGHCPDVPSDLRTDLWERGLAQPVYIFPDDAGELLEIVGGVGDTQLVTTIGLDGTGLPKLESQNLNGTTPVSLTGLWSAVNRSFNDDTTDLTAQAVVQGDGSTSTNIFAVIDTDDQQTSQAIYKVPLGKVAVMYYPNSTVNKSVGADTSGIFGLRVAKPGKMFRTRFRYGLQRQGSSRDTSKGNLPILLALPLSKIKISVTATVGPTDVSGGFPMYLVDESLVPDDIIANLLLT